MLFLVNNESPDDDLMSFYKEEGDLVCNDLLDHSKVVEKKLLGKGTAPKKGDLIKRNLIRHDIDKLAVEIMNIIEHGKIF